MRLFHPAEFDHIIRLITLSAFTIISIVGCIYNCYFIVFIPQDSSPLFSLIGPILKCEFDPENAKENERKVVEVFNL